MQSILQGQVQQQYNKGIENTSSTSHPRRVRVATLAKWVVSRFPSRAGLTTVSPSDTDSRERKQLQLFRINHFLKMRHTGL